MEKTIRLTAKDKKGNYVDSITTNNQETVKNFFIDFNDCVISTEIFGGDSQ